MARRHPVALTLGILLVIVGRPAPAEAGLYPVADDDVPGNALDLLRSAVATRVLKPPPDAPVSPAAPAPVPTPAVVDIDLTLGVSLEPLALPAAAEDASGNALDLLLSAATAGSLDLPADARVPFATAAPLLDAPVADLDLAPGVSLKRFALPAALQRPRALVPLYVSFAVAQGLDYNSTRRAIGSGLGREANPLAMPFVATGPGLLLAKAALTAGIVLAGERIWRKNRISALVLVGAADAAVLAISVHNYAITPGAPGSQLRH